jgi:hypothetical protein
MTITPRRLARLALPFLAMAALASPLAGQRTERYSLTSRNPVVHNLAGEVTVVPGSGSAVVVEVTRLGQDAGRLRVNRESGAVRVVYPGDRVVYPRMGARSRTTTQVRRDGTLGPAFLGSRSVTVAGSGEGTRAYADVRVLVPAGRAVAVYQAVGAVQVTNVNGRVEVVGRSLAVRAQGTRGVLDVGVDSGVVHVSNAQGEVTVEAGAGALTVDNVRGTTLEMSTGKGNVRASNLRVQTLEVDVGSGSVTLGGVHARDVSVDAGSGGVTLGMLSDADLAVETGSGAIDITVPASFGAALEIGTGSGDITVDLPVANRRASRGRFTGRVGDGNGTVQISANSGTVRIRRG